jgi:hypothetical protein
LGSPALPRTSSLSAKAGPAAANADIAAAKPSLSQILRALLISIMSP